jgi:hypothetical protein
MKCYEADPSKKLQAQKNLTRLTLAKSGRLKEIVTMLILVKNKRQQRTGTTPILFQRKLRMWCITNTAQCKRTMQDYYTAQRKCAMQDRRCC